MTRAIPKNALIVVADGRKAILLRNQGAGGEVSLNEERRLSPKDLKDDGLSGSRPEEQTPHQTDEATFAKQLANMLQQMKQSGAYASLVLVADPQNTMHKEVEASLVLTLAKDLTNHSVAEIAKALG